MSLTWNISVHACMFYLLVLGNSELRLVQSQIYSQMRGVFQSQNTIQNETTSRVGTNSESLYPD